MNLIQFQSALDERVARHDLLTHPFCQAWTAGKLSLGHLRAYAQEYFHFVAAYPTFLSALHCRLADGALRRAVLRNLAEEEIEGCAHSDMWLEFAEGVGLSPEQVRRSSPSAAVRQLIDCFYRIASHASPAEVLAALYAYESQVPRISGEKARALVTPLRCRSPHLRVFCSPHLRRCPPFADLARATRPPGRPPRQARRARSELGRAGRPMALAGA